MRSKPRTRKRPFLLLEVMVSLLLVALILGPLIAPLCNMRKAEGKLGVRMEMAREARLFFAEIKEGLYSGSLHAWSQLEKGGEGFLHEHTCNNKQFQARYILEPVDSHHKTSTGAKFLLLDCSLFVSCGKEEKCFHYPLLLEKRGTK